MTKPKTKQKKNDAGDKDAASVDNKCAESPLSNGSSSSAQPTRSPSLSSEWTSNSIPPSLTKSPSISSEWLVADIQTMILANKMMARIEHAWEMVQVHSRNVSEEPMYTMAVA